MKNFGNSGFLARSAGFGFAVVLSVAAVTSARATVLASYPFTGSSLASTDTDPASVASDITLGSGLTDTLRFATNGNPGAALRVNSDETDGTTFATAVTAGDYFGFQLTPSAGDRFFFQTATIDLAASVATLSTNVRLQASINGAAFVTVDSVSAFSTTTYTAETFDLTFGNTNAAIANGASVVLRVLVYDNGSSATVYTGFDNLIVNGTVGAIPEPGTAALLALGVLGTGGVVLRRSRRKASLK